MMQRRMQRENSMNRQTGSTKTTSLSTEESRSPKNMPKCTYKNKEKSQLCRKFMEKGYCPYEKRCKFAHGSHELQRNNTINSKYKTKECGAFFNEGHCRFGERCNFLHSHKQPQFSNKWQEVKKDYREIFTISTTSKLLTLL